MGVGLGRAHYHHLSDAVTPRLRGTNQMRGKCASARRLPASGLPSWVLPSATLWIENLAVRRDGVIVLGCATTRPSAWWAGQPCPAEVSPVARLTAGRDLTVEAMPDGRVSRRGWFGRRRRNRRAVVQECLRRFPQGRFASEATRLLGGQR